MLPHIIVTQCSNMQIYLISIIMNINVNLRNKRTPRKFIGVTYISVANHSKILKLGTKLMLNHRALIQVLYEKYSNCKLTNLNEQTKIERKMLSNA